MLYHRLDLHQMTLVEAKLELQKTLDTLPKEVAELVVIHGYRHGDAIKQLVTAFKHCRIKRKIRTMNQGETIFLIQDC